MIKIFNNLFVTFFYIGTVRYAPGTVASLITTIFLFSSFYILKLSNQLVLVIFLIFLVYSFIAVSIYIKHSENKDPKEVVIDEVLGQSIPIITFEFSHFMSPQSAYKQAGHLFNRYNDYLKLI